jgi:hypothetical protein
MLTGRTPGWRNQKARAEAQRQSTLLHRPIPSRDRARRVSSSCRLIRSRVRCALSATAAAASRSMWACSRIASACSRASRAARRTAAGWAIGAKYRTSARPGRVARGVGSGRKGKLFRTLTTVVVLTQSPAHPHPLPSATGMDDRMVKQEAVAFLTSNPGLYYCRMCLAQQVQVPHDELRNVMPTVGVVAPDIVTRQGPCVTCRNLRTVFAYDPHRSGRGDAGSNAA